MRNRFRKVIPDDSSRNEELDDNTGNQISKQIQKNDLFFRVKQTVMEELQELEHNNENVPINDLFSRVKQIVKQKLEHNNENDLQNEKKLIVEEIVKQKLEHNNENDLQNEKKLIVEEIEKTDVEEESQELILYSGIEELIVNAINNLVITRPLDPVRLFHKLYSH